MINFISFYLLGGLIWSLITEYLNNIEIGEYKKTVLTTLERVLTIIIWPYLFLIFMVAFIKTLFKL
jgi:membrane protein DedA with SNARE-associated domain